MLCSHELQEAVDRLDAEIEAAAIVYIEEQGMSLDEALAVARAEVRQKRKQRTYQNKKSSQPSS